MAPTNTLKRKSHEMEEQSTEATTPTGSPARKKLRVTIQQKQALMDNLQLEITERARQLRAGYALQASDLRARIERRVNRIPLTLRKMTMGELMQQHEATKSPQRVPSPKQAIVVEGPAPKPLPALPQEHITIKAPSPARTQVQPAPTRGKKRMSPEIHIAADKENEQPPASDTLPVLKNTKRGKTTTTTTQDKRTASRTAASSTKEPSNVLSPRSHNSRTLPHSPIKDPYLAPTSPAKSMIARPTTAISPIRPTSPLKSAATAATSAISASMQGMIEHAKRGGTATAMKLSRTASKEKKELTAGKGQMLPPPKPHLPSAPPSPQRAFSQTSVHSNTTDISTASSGTTVVKPKRGTRAAATAKTTMKTTTEVEKKKGGVARAASAAKSALKRNVGGNVTGATGKKVVLAEPAAGKRVLRKRA